MEIFLLIHGAFHGGWCWKLLADCLAEAGHCVYTPTLAGLGERAQMAPQTINLDTHIEDVCAVIEANDLRNVTLVGHSYGGMPIIGAHFNHSGVAHHLVDIPHALGRFTQTQLPPDGHAVSSIVRADLDVHEITGLKYTLSRFTMRQSRA